MLTHWCIRGLHGITCSAGTFKAKCGEKSATGYALQCGGLPTYIYIYQHIIHTITYMHMCKMIGHQLRHLKTGSQARKVFRNSRTLRKQHYSNAWHSHFRHQFCSWEWLGLQRNSPSSQNNPHKKCITSLEFELHPTTPVTNRFFGSLDLKHVSTPEDIPHICPSSPHIPTASEVSTRSTEKTTAQLPCPTGRPSVTSWEPQWTDSSWVTWSLVT